MNSLPLSRLAAVIQPDAVRGGTDCVVTQICYDSRRAQPGALFVAQPGVHVDGHRFIDDALAAGAVAVVHSRELSHYTAGITYLRVRDPAAALSRAAACFYGHPSRELTVVGVTGTNGKSTTAWWIYHLLRSLQVPVGLISTVGADYGAGPGANPEHVTTPLAVETHAALRAMVDAGREVAVVEASSWGLASGSKRLADVCFDIGVITNFSHDHLELHGSDAAYLEAKLNLFRGLRGRGAFGVAPPQLAAQVRAAAAVPVLVYGREQDPAGGGATASADDEPGDDAATPGERFVLHLDGAATGCTLTAPGPFNLDNCLAAATVVGRWRGLCAADLAAPIAALRLPSGHLEEVDCGQPFRVVVDYAHTPEAFRVTLSHLAGHARRAGGRVIAVFGSAGERDVVKRPQQGRIACQYADLVVLTDEDCRSEDPLAILHQIAAGCPGRTIGVDLVLEVEREAAIALAVAAARPRDVVVLLGKGHEASIIGPGGPRPWDERAAAVAALQAAGYG
jgi:UDP-N-acetylmuramoyl-L-alanyl-D-glutamate--2,6-diaminopimelate ligase